jgi:two-component sensor histidine kinase
LGGALFLLALTLTSTWPWFRSHYPYLAYFLATVIACYWLGPGPANLAAFLSALAVLFTFAPSGFLVSATQTPAAAALAVFLGLLGGNWLIGSLRTSRNRLAAERERYRRLAESRDLLYRELQHRVSNNIQIISGLLLLQSQALTDKAARHVLAEASGRVSLIARIQRQLQDHGGRSTPFASFARDLLADAIAISGAEEVRVEIEGGEEPLHASQATAVSLVLLECVNNALEHAFAGGGGGGRVRVSMRREGPSHVLVVADDGAGLPDGFELDAANSLGLKIVRTMTGQLEGRFSMTPLDKGIACRLTFPVLDG